MKTKPFYIKLNLLHHPRLGCGVNIMTYEAKFPFLLKKQNACENKRFQENTNLFWKV